MEPIGKKIEEQIVSTTLMHPNLKEQAMPLPTGVTVGDVVHYHDGFGEFVRCYVSEHGLIPVSLVGEWKHEDSFWRWDQRISSHAPIATHQDNLWERSRALQEQYEDPRAQERLYRPTDDTFPTPEVREGPAEL